MLLKSILPESKEYVLCVRKSPVQRELYKLFVQFVRSELQGDKKSYYNPLKAQNICGKIYNHPGIYFN